jgi:hypothetical protein
VPIRRDILDIMMCRISQLVMRIILMQAHYFILLSELSDPFPSLTFTIIEGCYGRQTIVMSWPKLPESIRATPSPIRLAQALEKN